MYVGLITFKQDLKLLSFHQLLVIFVITLLVIFVFNV